MPVATATKITALSEDLGSQRRRRRAARGEPGAGDSLAQRRRDRPRQRGAGGPARARRSRACSASIAPEAAEQWLLGLNPRLGDRRPVDLVRFRPHPGAARGDRRRARRRLCVRLWRTLPFDRGAAPDEPGGALWFPREQQGHGRHDNPRSLRLYLRALRIAVSAVAEPLAAFRGTGPIDGGLMLTRLGRTAGARRA